MKIPSTMKRYKIVKGKRRWMNIVTDLPKKEVEDGLEKGWKAVEIKEKKEEDGFECRPDYNHWLCKLPKVEL